MDNNSDSLQDLQQQIDSIKQSIDKSSLLNKDSKNDSPFGNTRLGAGSGFDSDMVDGIHASYKAMPNTLIPLGSNNRFPSGIFPAGVPDGTATSGNIMIGNGTTWQSEPITGDITLSSLGVVSVTKIKGSTLGTVTPTDKYVLMGDSTKWNAVNLSGGVTVTADTGVVQLNAPGSSGQVMFNSSSLFAGVNNLFWDITNHRLGINASAAPVTAFHVVGQQTNVDPTAGTLPNPFSYNGQNYGSIQLFGKQANGQLNLIMCETPHDSGGGSYFSTVQFARQVGTTASETALNSGDALGKILFFGTTAANTFSLASGIEFLADGNWSASVAPTKMTFYTTPSGSLTYTEALRINKSQFSGFGNVDAAYRVDVNGDINLTGTLRVSGTAYASTNLSDSSTLVRSGDTAGGDLSGTYRNPTVAKINGVTLGTTTATDKNILIADGTDWDSVAITGDLTYTNLGVFTVAKINGVALGTTTATDKNILVADGTDWDSVAVSGDVTISNLGAVTLATVNSNVGTFGSATKSVTLTVNAKGLVTAASESTITGVAPGSITLTNAHVLVGNGSNVAADVAVSGDVTLANTGAFTLNTVTIAKGGTNSTTALSGNSIIISDGTSIVQGAKGTTTTLLHGNAAGSPTYSAVSLTADVTGTLPIANGGTGQTTASAAFNALSPVTSTGDLVLGNGSNSSTRLAIGTNGYVLTSNGTTASWAAVTASAAGATGSIQFATSGSLDSDNSNFFWDKTNHRLGIGTTTPQIPFAVWGANSSPSLSASNGIIGFRTATDHTMLEFGGYLASPYALWIQGKDSDNDGVSFPLVLNPLGGNVGIGTTGPTERLHVAGGNIIADSDNAIGWGARSVQLAGHQVGSTSDYLRFDTNNAEKMRLDGTGRLLIGETTYSAGAGASTTLETYNGSHNYLFVRSPNTSSDATVASNDGTYQVYSGLLGGSGGGTTGTWCVYAGGIRLKVAQDGTVTVPGTLTITGLTTVGSAGITFNDATTQTSAASMTLVSTSNPSGVASVTFGSLVSGARYLLRWNLSHSTTGQNTKIRFGYSSGTIDTGSNYEWEVLGATNSAGAGQTSLTLETTGVSIVSPDVTEGDFYFSLNQAANKKVSAHWSCSFTGTTQIRTSYGAGYWISGNNTLTDIQVLVGSGNITGRLSLYRIWD